MKIKLDKGAFMPERAHESDAGLDLKSMEDAIVPAGGSYIFDTGVHIELHDIDVVVPEYYETKELCGIKTMACSFPTVAFLKSKSGLNIKHNITSEGVIDQGFTGSIKVKLYNHGAEDYQIKRGDKISQLVIVPILIPELEVVDELEETDRGENGFGSTGR